MKKVIIAVIAIIAIAGFALLKLVNNQAGLEVDAFIAQTLEQGNYREISYESVEVGISGEFTLTNLHIIDEMGNDFIIEELQALDFDFLNETPHHMTIRASGLKLPNGIPDLGALQLQSQGMEDFLGMLVVEDRIPLTMNYHYEYDPDDNHLLDNEFSIGIEDAANFSFNSTIKNVSLEEFSKLANMDEQQAQMQLLSYMEVAELPQMSMSIEDMGVLDLLLSIQGEESGMSAEEMRQQLSAQAESLMFFAPPELQELATDISAQLVSFLDGDKTLSISIEPELEGNIQRLQPEIMSAVFGGDYGRVIELLNLNIVAQ